MINKVRYDICAKRILSQKIILAHILVKTVEEFKGMNPKDVEEYIEGEPYISTIPIEPGLTNIELRDSKGKKIIGRNTEDTQINEGKVTFDIVFDVRLKNYVTKIIINIEVQKDNPTKYHILNRGVFYTSRLISSQKEIEFTNMNYDDLKSVTSIWICMNIEADCLSYYHLTKKELLEEYEWEGNIDLINIVLIGMKNEVAEKRENYELHRLLGVLFSDSMPVDEKLDIIEKEYGITINDDESEVIKEMCNLADGIEERGYNKCIIEIVMNMYEEGCKIEQIAKVTKRSEEEIREVIDKVD